MEIRKTIQLRSYEGNEDTTYVELRDHPNELVFGIVASTIDVHNLVDGYIGPRLSVEFDKDKHPIGIEIIYPEGYTGEIETQ